MRSVKTKFQQQLESQALSGVPDQPLVLELQQNVELLRSIYANCADMTFRSFSIGGAQSACLLYIDGLSNLRLIDDFILSPLMQGQADELRDLQHLIQHKLPVSSLQVIKTSKECVEYLSMGFSVLLCEGEEQALALGVSEWEKRAIEEPSAEVGIRGPREGFTETLRINMSQVRRIVKSPAMKFEPYKVGGYTQTNLMLAYIDGLVDPTLVEEVKARLQRIKIDGVLESGYIEELIEDNPYSPFPQLLTTERPDVVCGNLLEGKVAILVEGSPVALVAPTTFFALFQAAEDYYQRSMISTLIRWLRYLFLSISLLLPSLYVAVITFHQEMVPAPLLFSMASSREEVPFPALVEALMMEVTFEALREAGVRLPKQVGAAVSIVGALVIGQSAVQADLVSAPMVIVVAITGIASFMVPRYIAGIAIRMLRFPIILLAGSFGLLGVMMGIIALVLHLCSLRSFGVPFLSPASTLQVEGMKDTLLRSHWWKMDQRPHLTGEFDEYRQAPDQKPATDRGGES